MDDWHPRAPHPGPLTWPTPLDPTGRAGPTRGQARGPGWRRTSQGLHVPAADRPASVEQRIVEESARLRGRGAVTGWAALRMHGGAYFDGRGRDGRTPVPVALVAGTSRVGPALRSALAEADVLERHGVRVTSVERAVLDELRRLRDDLREMVVVIDMTLAARLTTLQRLRRHLHRARGVPEPAWQAIGLADSHVLSPQETRLRLIWMLDAGLPRPECNPRIYSRPTGRFVGMPDLLDPESGLVAEYNGAVHRTAAQQRLDAERQERFADSGLETCVFVGADLFGVRRVVARLRAAHARAGERPTKWVREHRDAERT